MSPDEMNAIYQMLGSIDARIAAVQGDVTELKRVQGEIFAKLNKQQSQLDTLQQAHNDRIAAGEGGCNQINMPAGTNPIPKWILTLSSGLGVVGVVAMIVLFILLHKYGII